MTSTTTTGPRRVRVGACGCAWVCSGVGRHTWMCVGMHRCARVCAGVYSVDRCAQVCTGVRRCVEVCGCLQVCVYDEFSEYLLENRVPTSADFNTYPIRIFNTKVLLLIFSNSVQRFYY